MPYVGADERGQAPKQCRKIRGLTPYAAVVAAPHLFVGPGVLELGQ